MKQDAHAHQSKMLLKTIEQKKAANIANFNVQSRSREEKDNEKEEDLDLMISLGDQTESSGRRIGHPILLNSHSSLQSA